MTFVVIWTVPVSDVWLLFPVYNEYTTVYGVPRPRRVRYRLRGTPSTSPRRVRHRIPRPWRVRCRLQDTVHDVYDTVRRHQICLRHLHDFVSSRRDQNVAIVAHGRPQLWVVGGGGGGGGGGGDVSQNYHDNYDKDKDWYVYCIMLKK